MAEAMKGPLLSNKTAEEATRPLVSCAIAFIVVNTLFVAGRFFSRHYIAKLPFWWDDFWVLPAYALNLGMAAIGIYLSKVEVAYDNEDRIIFNLDEASQILKGIFAFIQLLLPAFATTRFSILALYLRIFTARGVRIAVWTSVAFITVQYIAFAIAALNQCAPVSFFWDRAIAGGKCFNIDTFYRSITIPNIVMDVVLVVIPIPTVWQLKATRTRKAALTFVFCIGTVALVASCIRLWVFETHTGVILAPQYTSVLISWLIAEPSVYLIASCLPAMHHVFAFLVPRVISDAVERRMAAWKHPLSRTAHETGASRDYEPHLPKHAVWGPAADFTRLADSDGGSTKGNSSSCVQAERKNSKRKDSGRDDEAFEMMESGKLPLGGIVVTHEVIVTQEERIADVMGF